MSWIRITKYVLTRLAFASVMPAIPQVVPQRTPPLIRPPARHCFVARRGCGKRPIQFTAVRP